MVGLQVRPQCRPRLHPAASRRLLQDVAGAVGAARLQAAHVLACPTQPLALKNLAGQRTLTPKWFPLHRHRLVTCYQMPGFPRPRSFLWPQLAVPQAKGILTLPHALYRPPPGAH